jgi:hypothetical protein
MNWTVATRKIAPGDRAFLLRQGHQRGLVGSGVIQSAPYPDKHWDRSGRLAEYCDVEFDVILSPDERLPIEVLQKRLPAVHWVPQQSGTRVRPPADDELEELWRTHLAEIGRGVTPADY